MTGIDKKLARDFDVFLKAGGAEVLPTTNPWELARFKSNHGVCVVYQNAKGRVTYSNEHAHDAHSAFVDKRAWSACEVKDRVKRKTVEQLLIERDGENCFYCNALFDPLVKPTLEHLLSIKHGGNNHLSNLALACKPCNEEAGHLPVIEKAKLRERKRFA